MSLRFSQVAARFLKWAEACRSPVTVNVYRHYFRRFLAEVGDKRMGALRPCDLTAWAKTWHQSQAIVRLYRWAIEEAALLKMNPLQWVKHPPKGQRSRVLSDTEMNQLIQAAASDLRTLLIGYRETMARPGELRAAKVGDLHPRTTRAKLRKALCAGEACIVLRDYKNRKTRRLPNEPRVILLSPTIGRVIAALLRRCVSDTDPIWRTARGKAWTANALRCRLRRLRRRLALGPDKHGENLVPYSFRHTGATRFTAAGVRDRTLADILGHTEVSTTARYQHLCVEDLRAACRKIWDVARSKATRAAFRRKPRPSPNPG